MGICIHIAAIWSCSFSLTYSSQDWFITHCHFTYHLVWILNPGMMRWSKECFHVWGNGVVITPSCLKQWGPIQSLKYTVMLQCTFSAFHVVIMDLNSSVKLGGTIARISMEGQNKHKLLKFWYLNAINCNELTVTGTINFHSEVQELRSSSGTALYLVLGKLEIKIPKVISSDSIFTTLQGNSMWTD